MRMRLRAAAKSRGANPRRFMPVSILIQMAKRPAPPRLLEQLDLTGVVNDEIEAVVRGILELRAAEHPLEQHDARGDAGRAQRHALLQARHGEGAGILDRQRRAHQSMPVGVGLDDRDELRAPGAGADDIQVVAQGLSVDDGPDQPAHRKTPSA